MTDIVAYKVAFAICLGTIGLSALIAWILNKKFDLNFEGVFLLSEIIQLILIIFLVI